ncbi:MAG: hypothetical protein V1725_01870 [archaeon]
MQLSPLKAALKPLLKYAEIEGIYIYGSSITQDNPNDIDILIVVNDLAPILHHDRIKQTCDTILKSSKLKLHFQPIKELSKWWFLLMEGEPWLVSSLKDILIIHDRQGLIKKVASFVKEEKLFRKEQKAERLMERSDASAAWNRQLLLDGMNALANAGTEAAQVLLLFDNKLMLNKREIAEALASYTKVLGEEIIGNYQEIIDLQEKIQQGTLSQVSAENIDYYLEKIRKFIVTVEEKLAQ